MAIEIVMGHLNASQPTTVPKLPLPLLLSTTTINCVILIVLKHFFNFLQLIIVHWNLAKHPSVPLEPDMFLSAGTDN